MAVDVEDIPEQEKEVDDNFEILPLEKLTIKNSIQEPPTVGNSELLLLVYEAEIKIQSSSSSNFQNVAFVSLENISSTNEAVNTAHEVSTANSQGQASSSSYADDVMFSFFVSQSNSQQLDNEDLEQIDTDDLKEMDLKWAPRNQENRNGDVSRRIVPLKTPANALVVQDEISGSSSSSSSDSEEIIGEGFHAVPPPYTRNYMPSRPDLLLRCGGRDSVYKTKMSETETSISKTSKDIIEKPKTVRPSALIIED
ncbi:hypothetical protein Tco_1251186 [Tanacetum coccineum]